MYGWGMVCGVEWTFAALASQLVAVLLPRVTLEHHWFKWDKRDCLVWGWRQVSNETTRLSCMGVGWRWRILSSDETSELILFRGGVEENFLRRQARLSRMGVGWRWRILSNETSELISFGGGEYFVASKRDCLVWGWGRDTLHTILMTSHT